MLEASLLSLTALNGYTGWSLSSAGPDGNYQDGLVTRVPHLIGGNQTEARGV